MCFEYEKLKMNEICDRHACTQQAQIVMDNVFFNEICKAAAPAGVAHTMGREAALARRAPAADLAERVFRHVAELSFCYLAARTFSNLAEQVFLYLTQQKFRHLAERTFRQLTERPFRYLAERHASLPDQTDVSSRDGTSVDLVTERTFR